MIKAIALYLPQFHPIPENDEWWGKGFTEWTNVTKAEVLFKNHRQPRLPADLGFYDLRVPEVRQAQAEIARAYGIYGFCYWHYWFSGRRIIERPFLEMVESGEPDFPFCASWANQTWSGTWHGLANKKILIEQEYPGKKDFEKHFEAMLPSFQDKRYIEIKGRKLFFVFRPMDMPLPKLFTDTWQELAQKNGLKGIHFVGMHMGADWDYSKYGYQAFSESGPQLHKYKGPSFSEKVLHKLFNVDLDKLKRQKMKLPDKVSYSNYVKNYPDHAMAKNEYPMIYPDWDNTPRSGSDGWLFENSTPELFRELCLKAFKETENKNPDEKIVLLKSWNEWAEGNYLEPDSKWGHSYLQSFQKAVVAFNKK